MKIVKPVAVTDANLVSSTVPENDFAEYSSGTSYTLGQKVIVSSAHRIYQSLRGGSSTVTITYNSPTVIGWKAHGLANGTAVTFSTTGAMPAGLVAGTSYYVVNANTDTFNVSATLSGTAINTTSAGSGAFTCYDTPNIGNAPATNPTWWLDCGATNRWKPFDALVQSQMTATTTASIVVSTQQRVDTVAVLNVTPGTTGITVQATYGASGVVYNSTTNLYQDETNIEDWLTYFDADFRQQQDVVLMDLPAYYGMTVSITITGATGATVGLGEIVIGQAKDISSAKMGVEQGAKISITDYSVKTTDDFGNYTIKPRAFAKRANWDVWVNNADLDFACNLLTSIRTTPTLYIGGSKYSSVAIYGYYKSWEATISYPDISVFTLEVDGLT